MNTRANVTLAGMLFLSLSGKVTLCQDDEFRHRTVSFQGRQRTYFVALPKEFVAESKYWPLVFAHGGAGNVRANSIARNLRRFADDAGLPTILILPEFVTEDKQVSRFPALGEDAFLKAVLQDARSEFDLHNKILLAGYSMGGQFAHRFALANPELVLACAPCAAGTWTTPDGRLLIESHGVVTDPQRFLASSENAARVPERLSDLFDARTAKVAGMPAASGANEVAFLVMCGTLDPRHDIAVTFARSLHEAGFSVETEWPSTGHGPQSGKYASEFEKFPRSTVRFFQKQIELLR